MNSRFCLPALWLVLALPATALPATVPAATFQPLNSPATGEHRPGKFVWADLFTTDPARATRFYCGLFGWTASQISQNGKAYTVFSNGSHPVAGLAPRANVTRARPSRWIGYLAVADLPATLQLVRKAGGQVRAEARDFPQRGSQAIITDPEGAPLGLLQSSSGDAPDTEPAPGDWNWFELYARQPAAASVFCHEALAYDAAPDQRTERTDDILLSSGGRPRAGIAPIPARADAKPGWLGVVRVAHIEETLARVIDLGGTILVAARPAAYGSRFALISDSTGGTVGLIEYVDQANPANRP